MPLIAVPNVSEGRDEQRIDHFTEVMAAAGADVLDIHRDAVHHRSVVTVTGGDDSLIAAAVALAAACTETIDLQVHKGAHPRLGALDVCPFVPHEAELEQAVVVARETGARIARELDLPVYYYGDAARRETTSELPDLRRGGLEALARRARADLPPDDGPANIDPRRGVVCVGAREVLIAFNVWLDARSQRAEEIAARIRGQGGGLPGVRALGIALDAERSQVSMNLTDPERAGIDEAFAAVDAAAVDAGITVSATEIVGLVPERFLPKPNTKAARLLIEPGRSLESALAD